MAPQADDKLVLIFLIFPFGAPVATKVSEGNENLLSELPKSPVQSPNHIQITSIGENFMQLEARKLVHNVEHPVTSSDS